MVAFGCPNTSFSRLIRRIGNGFDRKDINTRLKATAALSGTRPGLWILRCAMLLVVLLAPSVAIPAVADYRLHRGDVLEISVWGSPELHRRIMINDAGKIYLPLLGELTVVNLSLPQLHQQLHDLLKIHIPDPRVTVDVAEYRPVYVTGDVSKPGAYPYRPGITVRDAVSLAGGYNVMPLIGRDAVSETIEIRDQYDALSIEFARLQIRVARLRAELAGKTEIDLKKLQTDGVMSLVLSEFANMEAQQLRMDRDDYDKESTHLARLITETENQISALVAEQKQQQLDLARHQKDVATVESLFQKSLVQIARVEEEQRQLSMSQIDLFRVEASVAQARRDLEVYTRNLQKLADQRKIDVIQRLEAATGELATVRLHLETVGEKVRYIEAGKPQSLLDGSKVRDLVIFRKEHGDPQRIAAAEDTDLLPGDAVEITMRPPSHPQGLAWAPDLPHLAAAPPSKGEQALATDPEAAARAAQGHIGMGAAAGKPIDAPRRILASARDAAPNPPRGATAPMHVPPASGTKHEMTGQTIAAVPPKPATVLPHPQTMAAIAATREPPDRAVASRNLASAPSMQRDGKAQPIATAPSKPADPARRQTIAAIEATSKPPDHAAAGGNVGSATGWKPEELKLSDVEVNALVSRGDALLGDGDVTSARLFYQRAADGGDSMAALRLGETFDPAFLEQARLGRAAADPKQALYWYLRADDLGNSNAEPLLKSFQAGRQ